MKNNIQENNSEAFYFSSPAEAVQIISKILLESNFKILARYYDLSDSEIKLSELESGDFFIRKERPKVAHPGGFWRYKHPFAPGFKFNSLQSTDKEGVYLVRVMVEIEQEGGFPQQIGYSDFYMIKSAKGWKVLPDQVTEE